MVLAWPTDLGIDQTTGAPPQPDNPAQALAVIASQQPPTPPPQAPAATYDAPPASAPQSSGKYSPQIERWRGPVTQELQKQGVPLSLNGVDLVDKALHVIQGESGGNPDAVGDGGAAHGLFQSHYVGEGASTSAQIADAVKLIAKNPAQWTDWGEDTTYNGASFGALGRTPYGSGAGSSAGLAVGSAIAQQQASTPDTAAISQTASPDTGNFGLPFSQPATDATATADVGGPAPQQDFSQALAPIAPLSNTPDIDQQAPGALRQQAIDQGAYNNRTFPIAQRLQNQAGDVGAAIGGVIPDFSVPRNAYDKGISYEDGTQKSPSMNISPRELGRGYAKTFVPASETEFATYGPMMAANIQGLEPLSRLPGAIAGAGRSLLETGGGSIIRNEGEQAAAGLTGEAAAGANAGPSPSGTVRSAPASASLNPKSPEAIASVARDEAAAKGARLANIDVSKTEWTTPAEKDAAITTALDTHLGGDADVTLYRGTNPSRNPLTTSTAADEGPGKWWTTDAKVAENYAGPNGEVQKAVVKASDLADPEHANPIGGPNSGEWTLSKDLQNRAVTPSEAPAIPNAVEPAVAGPRAAGGAVSQGVSAPPAAEAASFSSTADLHPDYSTTLKDAGIPDSSPGRPQGDGYLYHATPTSNLESLAKEGLKPSNAASEDMRASLAERARFYKQNYDVTLPKNVIYAADNSKILSAVDRDANEAGGWSVTRFKPGSSQWAKDPEWSASDPGAWTSKQAIPANQLEVLTKNGWQPLAPQSAAEPPLSDLERQMQASLRGAKPATSAPKTPAAMRQELEAAGVNTEGKTVAQVVSRYRQFASESSTTATPIENVSNVAREAYNKTLSQTGDLDAAKLAARKAAAQEGGANARAGALINMLDQGYHAGPAGTNPLGKSPLEQAVSDLIPKDLPSSLQAVQKPIPGFELPPEVSNEPVANRVMREFGSLLTAPIRTATFGHAPIFRQGFLEAITHPAAAQQAMKDLFEVAKDPEVMAQIQQRNNALPFVKRGIETGLIKETPQYPKTFVDQLIEKIPFMRNSSDSAHIYLDTLRKAAYEDGAQKLKAAGVKDDYFYKDLWAQAEHATGIGLDRGSLKVGGINPFFSPQALVGRFRSLLDVAVGSGGISPLGVGSRPEAIRNLIALAGVVEGVHGLADLTGAADVKQDVKTPLGKVKVGFSTIDPSAGYNSIFKMAINMGDAIAHDNRQKFADAATSYLRGQLGPVNDLGMSLLTGKDWKGSSQSPTAALKDFGYGSVPIAGKSIYDSVAENGPVGALYAAASLGAMGVETNRLAAERDKSAMALGQQGVKDINGKPLTAYADAGPVVKAQIDKTQNVVAQKPSPTPYQASAAQSQAPVYQERDRQEGLFAQGQNDKALRDVYHDQGVALRQSAHDLEDQYAKQFAGFSKTKYDTAVNGYFALDQQSKNEKGDIDFDKLASLQNDYVAKLPADQQQWVKETLQVSEDKKSDTQKGYDKYVAAKKAAGYFDIDPNDPKAAQKRSALDMSHANIDEMGWKYGSTTGKPGGALNSPQAVQLALADPFSKNMPVKFQGFDRAINQSPQIEQLWQDQGQRLADYGDTGKLVTKYGNQAAQELYNKPYAQLSLNEQASALSHIRSGIRDSSPSLQALLIYMGDNIRNNEITVPNDAAVVGALKALQSKYGIAPPKPGVKYVPAKN